MRPTVLAVLLAALVSLALVGTAGAQATPVGPLPAGPIQEIEVKRGQPFAVALPRASASSGLVWRIARQYDADVVQQAEEADVSARTVVVVFRATGVGRTSVIFAQTRGDGSARAVKALRYRIRVR